MASKFKNKTIAEYKSKGYKVISLIRLSENGFPDLLCLKNSETLWIECKEINDTLKDLQKFRIDELINNGFDAFCLQDTKGKIYPF